MTDDLEQLEGWAGVLLDRIAPAQRRQLARTLGRELRRSQQQRIAEQRNPDGSAYAPRKRQPLRNKTGRIKRGAMFQQLRKAKHFKIKAGQDGVAVGFFGRVARIARVHQQGSVDRVQPGGPTVRYPQRVLLGFTDAEREQIRDTLIQQLSGQ